MVQAARRGALRAAPRGQPAPRHGRLLVLDPQAASPLLRRRTQPRRWRRRRGPSRSSGPRRRSWRGGGIPLLPAPSRGRRSTTRPPDGERRLHRRGARRAPAASSRSGPRTARDIFRQSAWPWSRPRRRASRAATSRPSSSTRRPFARRDGFGQGTRPALRSETAARVSAAGRGFEAQRRRATCAPPATVTCAGAPTARRGSSSASQAQLAPSAAARLVRQYHAGTARRAARPAHRDQGISGHLRPDRPGGAGRGADARGRSRTPAQQTASLLSGAATTACRLATVASADDQPGL